jgi:hypothetical protein
MGREHIARLAGRNSARTLRYRLPELGSTAASGRNRPIAERRTDGRFPNSHAPDLPFSYRPIVPYSAAEPRRYVEQ